MSNEESLDLPIQTRAFAFIDEAGRKGYISNLKPENDGEVCLLAAVVVSGEDLPSLEKAISPHFEKFKKAAPSNAKLHITEAFKPGNEAWAAIAIDVRDRCMSIILEHRPMIIYDARRALLAREEWIRRDTRAQDAIALTKDSIYKRTPKADDQLIDEYLAEGLFIKLDEFLRSIASQAGYTHITTYMDKVSDGIIKAYHRALTTVSNLSGGTTVSSAFNTTTREVEKRAIVMSVNAPFPLDVEHVAMPEVTGKDDSRIDLPP